MYLSRGVRFAHIGDGRLCGSKLTRKLSNAINDVDLRPFAVGDVIDLERPSAEMLVAEGWAEQMRDPANLRATADERPRTTCQRLNNLLANAPKPLRGRK